MCSKLKMYIARKLVEGLPKSIQLSPMTLKSMIKLSHDQHANKIVMNLPLNDLEKKIGIANTNTMMKIEPDEIVKGISYNTKRSHRTLLFEINKSIFFKEILEHPVNFPLVEKPTLKVVIDYSSPNVAKPFHVGHLRSTIIGNFIANLYKFLNGEVVRLNYLGDWGTQFGLIKVGIQKLNYTPDDIKEKPIERLYESYVYANKLASTDPSISKLAREEFLKLERGNPEDKEQWKNFITYTIEELKNTYQRLGVSFDEYHYESMYGAQDIEPILTFLTKKRILVPDSDGKKVAYINDRKVSLVKSDGSTLYLTRDIAAAIDRYKRYKFDRLYYVVENGQTDHFNALRHILHTMDMPWADRIKHVKFGRIHGMSTRKGNVVFLKDILDELKDLMVQKQIQSPTTKASITDSRTSDILGVSCIIVNDLKQRRQKDYKFSWDKVLQAEGDTGVKLQYTHCRLCSLEKKSGVIPATKCLPELIAEEEVVNLIREMGRFHEVLYKAEEQLEACVLVTYLFHFCNYVNRALKVLRVKDQDPLVGSQRLLIFLKAREVLAEGMKILGLSPLEEM